ncbi:CDP-glycerol glycerophosphotransferase family protein [Anaerosporobacter faecicola]|uniref:CDP-glycerol glycerophosphotransferase family protein n=1 Tax=Anaerosporobacter faecicola TaxID=2718714 RepID=UPI00143A08A1|nr:CDP-glycerol glycerophosphotransferase family protein [Anaerosporobacter faecicola]
MKKKTQFGLKYWAQLFLLPVYWISYITPRKKNIWLFGSTFGRRFADNPRYLYIYINEHYKDLRPIWLTHNKNVVTLLREQGYEAYYYHSLKGIWFGFRGKVYIFDNYSKDIDFWTSGGAVKINLWHGTGNKKANHDNLFDFVRHPRNRKEKIITWLRRLSDEKPYHYTLATSEPLAIITSSAFNTPLEHVIIDGYPRNDAMRLDDFPKVMNELEKKNYKNIVRWKEEGKKILFYMPTFRDSETKFFEIMDLDRFNTFLQNSNLMFGIKLHPKSKLKKEFSKIEYSNIFNIEADIDPYTFMGKVDLLVADYSSVYSDFMLLDRPVVSFFYDYEEYSHNTREGYVSFDEYMPEERAFNMDELMNKISSVLKNDKHKKDRLKSKQRMFKYYDTDSSKRLKEKIEKIIR